MTIAIILLAAGASRRMGGLDKLTEDVDGKPLLRRLAQVACASAADAVIVVLGARADERRVALEGLALQIVENPDWESGMASSVRTGIESLSPEAEAVLVMLGDMPEIGPDLLNRMMESFSPETGIDIVRPRADTGAAGNPVLFGKRHFAALRTLSGDAGARGVIAENLTAVRDVPADDGVLIDLDTPEAWARWRTRRNG